jgi:polyribonucleotide nucleotidyltransferase
LYGAPIKVVCKPLSLDRNDDLRVLGINAVSTAMALSSIPLLSNVAACRVAMIDSKVIFYGRLLILCF